MMVKRHIPMVFVLAVVLVGLVRITQYYWRQGTVLIGLALLLAGLLRALLPTERVGWVAVRGRGIDVLLYGGLGIAMLAVAVTITPGLFNK